MKNNLLPNIDLTNSREYYGAYNTRDLYKGKSFNMSGEWKAGTHYFNDESLQDFISYNGVLLSCNKTHIATINTMPEIIYRDENGTQVPEGLSNTTYWNFVLGGIPGTSKIYIPKFDEKTGLLTWDVSYDEVPVTPMNIKGVGITGISDETSESGNAQKITIQYGDGEYEVVEIPHGKPGKDGDTYKPSISQIDNETWKLSFVNSNNPADLITCDLDFAEILDKIQTDVKSDVTPTFKIENGELKVSFDENTWESVGVITKADSIDGGEITL